jgi:hypothetical protein
MSVNSMLAYRIGAISGVLFVALMFWAIALTDSTPPSPEDPSSVIASYMSSPSSQSSLAVSLHLVAIFVFFWFLASLRQILLGIDGGDGWLTSVAFGGGLVFATMSLVATSILAAGQILSDYGSDTQVAKSLFLLSWDFLYVFGPPLAALVTATAAIILRQSAFPRWVGWMSLPFALVLVIPPLAWPAVPLFFVWLLVFSVTLLIPGFTLTRRRPAPQLT